MCTVHNQVINVKVFVGNQRRYNRLQIATIVAHDTQLGLKTCEQSTHDAHTHRSLVDVTRIRQCDHDHHKHMCNELLHIATNEWVHRADTVGMNSVDDKWIR